MYFRTNEFNLSYSLGIESSNPATELKQTHSTVATVWVEAIKTLSHSSINHSNTAGDTVRGKPDIKPVSDLPGHNNGQLSNA